MLDVSDIPTAQELLQNPVFVGFLGAGLMGTVLFMARTIPARIFAAIKRQITIDLTVFDYDEIYPLLNLYLSRHPSARRARRFRVARFYDREEERDGSAVAPGEGFLLLRDHGQWILFHREIAEPSNGGYRRNETITLTMFGRSMKPMLDFIDRVSHAEENRNDLVIREWDMYSYRLSCRRPKRDLDTIYIRDDLKDAIVADLDRFLVSRDWYEQRAIPWRRGYLLAGKPGTGKSSLIFALACRLNKPVHLVNPASLENDDQLTRALSEARDGIVAIEDLDAIHDKPAKARGGDGIEKTDQEGDGITLSGLLNAIDGIAAAEGRILFITSNHPERLDPALLRAGRIDMRLDLEHAGRPEVEAMVKRFFPDMAPDEREAIIETIPVPCPQSDVQNRLLEIAG